jgi:hypothetical protein
MVWPLAGNAKTSFTIAGAVVGDQHHAVRLADDIADLARPQPGVQRHEHGPDLGKAQLDEHPLRAVVQPDRDVVALVDAEIHQRLGG